MARNKASQAPVQVGGLIVGNGPAAGGNGPVPAGTRFVTDGVTATNTTITSATAAFVAGDVGSEISGAGILPGTYISARASATSITVSQATTATATGVRIVITPCGLGSPYLLRKVAKASAIVTPTATFLTQTVYEASITVTGVKIGDIVVPIPPAGFETDAVISGCFVSAANTVKLRLSNPTAGSLTMAARVWGFLVIQMS